MSYPEFFVIHVLQAYLFSLYVEIHDLDYLAIKGHMAIYGHHVHLSDSKFGTKIFPSIQFIQSLYNVSTPGC